MTASDSGGNDDESKRLRRLETFLDTVYAVLFVQFIMYLPATEDMAWQARPFGLFSLLIDHWQDLSRMFVAVGLTLISWNLTHKLLGPLVRTDAVHTLITLLQLVFVCLFLFFAIADPSLQSISSPVGQSLSLAISGFIGLAGWSYANRLGYLIVEMSDTQKNDAGRNIIIEPVTAALNTGLAFVGPVSWTLGWFAVPLLLMGLRRLLESRK